jgi:oleate hydratase
MTAHLVGSGIASLAAAVYLIKDAKVAAGDITICGAMLMRKAPVAAGFPNRPKTAYVLPATRVLEKEHRCALELFPYFLSGSEKEETIEEDVLEFNKTYPYNDRTRLFDKYGPMKLSDTLGIDLINAGKALDLAMTPEDRLDGLAIDKFFTSGFYKSEFFLAWSTMMGPLREHSAIEFRRYLLRFLDVVPCVDTMEDVWRMRLNQDEGVAGPIANWLKGQGVQFRCSTVVEDVTLEKRAEGVRATSIKLKGARDAIPLGQDDCVFVTLGSQVANLAVGSMDQAPNPVADPKNAWALWKTMKGNAENLGRRDFGNPEVFFEPDDPSLSKWVTFTVTSTDPWFLDRLTALSGVAPRRQGLVSLVDSPWLITVAPFPKPHFVGQADDIWAWWGFSLCHDKDGCPDRLGGYVNKMITDCSGSEILEETIEQFGFGADKARILGSSVCIPCLLPHAGSVWLKRRNLDRPKVIPAGARNFAFIGQFCEIPKDTMFTMEYSIRSALEAVSGLFKLDVKAPDVYQGWDDAAAIEAVAVRYGLGQLGLGKLCPHAKAAA